MEAELNQKVTLSSRVSIAAKFLQTLYFSLERPNGFVLQEEYGAEERFGAEPSPRRLDRVLVLPRSSGHPFPNLNIFLPERPRKSLPRFNLVVKCVRFARVHPVNQYSRQEFNDQPSSTWVERGTAEVGCQPADPPSLDRFQAGQLADRTRATNRRRFCQ